MKVSARAEYACLAMWALACRPREEPLARIREIAEEQSIPETYLVQILQRLKGAGLVRSVRGSAGGYCLARGAAEITIAEILEAIDGELEPVMGSANAPGAAELARVWRAAREAEWAVLRGTSLESLIAASAASDWVI